MNPLTFPCVGLLLAVLCQTSTLRAEIAQAKRVLVFSKTLGYRHDNIPKGIAAIREIGAKHGFAVDATEDSAAFSRTNLARYQAVVFLSTTGDVLTQDQELAFKDFVLDGGGFVGIHGAVFGPSACEEKWGWYGQIFGCAFTNHSRVVHGKVLIEDSRHPSTKSLGKLWERTDEWYNFTGNPRSCSHVLATLDESSYTGGTMGSDHPIAWCRSVGKGRMWYTAMGHTDASFSEPLFLEHLAGGIRAVAGWAGPDATQQSQSARSTPVQKNLQSHY